MGGRREVAYQISDRVYLPKFISPKNPFATSARVEPPPNPAAAPVKKTMAAEKKKTQKLPTLPVARPRKRTWISRFNPVSAWRGSTPPQKTPCPRQAELSLDRVKVVHNDLTDADVEIVPIKSRRAPETAEPVVAPVQGEDSWSRLSAKIFGIKTT